MLVCKGAAHIDLEKVTEQIQWAGRGWERPEAANGRRGSFPGLAAHKPHSYLYRRSLKIEMKADFTQIRFLTRLLFSTATNSQEEESEQDYPEFSLPKLRCTQMLTL